MENIIRLKNDGKISNLEYSQMESKKENHLMFWILLSAFCGLIFVRNVLHIEYPIVVLLAFFCLIAFFADHNEIMALAISCIPFSAAFQYRYALFALIVIYLVKFPRSIKHFNAYIPLALMMFWELLHGVLPYDFSFVSYLQSFAELIFLSFVLSLGNKKFDLVLITRTLAVCVAFAGCVGVLKLLADTGYDFAAVFSGGYRLGINNREESSYVMNYNPNALGFMCNISICGLLILGRLKKLRAFDIIIIGLLVFIGFLTLARSFVLCLLFIAVSFLFVSLKSLSKLLKTLIIIFISVFLIFLILNYLAPYVLDNLLARFNEDDISNGRNELFAEYTEFMFYSVSNMIFGIGMQGVLDKVHSQGFMQIANFPHHGFQEIIINWGIFGIFLFAVLTLTIISFSLKINSNRKFANWIPLLLILFMAQSGQLLTSGYKLLSMLYAYYVLCVSVEDSENEN